MYNIMVDLLDRFYPEREITMTSSYPPFVTPAVKACAVTAGVTNGG